MKLANDDFIQINYCESPTLSSFIGPCEEEQVIDEVGHVNGCASTRSRVTLALAASL
ncbi:MAG: hypothetical protein H7288_13670 [Kineosporiaceae bacterium]|nr:hypothetical protein [Aeromicrobium sp.]